MKTTSEVTELVFKNELTEKGLADLRERFPSSLVFDMSDEKEFKLARKVKTERNKLTDAINQRRLDVTNELKTHGDSLIELVTDIYAVQVEPFEAENKRRKEVAAEEKRKLDSLLAKQRAEIAGIRQFLTDANTAASGQISGMVDAVGNIEASSFHKELVHEAIAVIDEVKSSLADMLLKQINAERLQEEADKAEAAAKAAQAEVARIQEEASAKAEELRLETEAREQGAEKIREVTERINKLRMIPMDVMGENSNVIKKKIASIGNVQINEEAFLTHVVEAEEARARVLEQLDSMLKQAEQLEALIPAEDPAPAIEYVQPIKQADEVAQEQAEVVQNNAQEIGEQRTFLGDINKWADKYQISKDAYNELGLIINQYV